MDIGDQTLVVAIADSSDEQTQGLMDVEDLGGLDGMLFVFEEVREATFSMKNTLIPLDLWFISADGAIVGSAEMAPCLSGSCPKFRSPGAVAEALETPLGRFDFAIGDIVSG